MSHLNVFESQHVLLDKMQTQRIYFSFGNQAKIFLKAVLILSKRLIKKSLQSDDTFQKKKPLLNLCSNYMSSLRCQKY